MFNNRLLHCLLPVLCLMATSIAQGGKKKTKPTQATVVIRGVHCQRDAQALLKELKKHKSFKVKVKRIETGKKPKFFSQLIAVSLGDSEKTDIGPLAQLVSRIKTPHRKEFPPKLNLILFTAEDIDEPSVMRLRRVLRSVNGLEVDKPGSLGGFPRKRFYWVQLENAGGASIREIKAALAKAKLNLKLTRKKKTD